MVLIDVCNRKDAVEQQPQQTMLVLSLIENGLDDEDKLGQTLFHVVH